MEEPQLAFGYEECENSPWEKVFPPEWGDVCPICDALEEKMSEEHVKALRIYQQTTQNLAGLRIKRMRAQTPKIIRKTQNRMARLLQIVNRIRKEAYLLEELMYEARDYKTVCLSCYGKKCSTEARAF